MFGIAAMDSFDGWRWGGARLKKLDGGDDAGGVTSSKLELEMSTCIRDHGHACGSRRSELTDYLGENPGGNLGTAQANPCCWLTPIGS